jgi:hypothetical protein
MHNIMPTPILIKAKERKSTEKQFPNLARIFVKIDLFPDIQYKNYNLSY